VIENENLVIFDRLILLLCVIFWVCFQLPPSIFFFLFKHNNKQEVLAVCCCCCCWESLGFAVFVLGKKWSRWLVDERPGNFFFVRGFCSHTDACNEKTKKNPIMNRKKKKNLGCTFFLSGYIPVDIYPTSFITDNK
jgi:hypothetical protein